MNYKEIFKQYNLKFAFIQYGVMILFIILIRPSNMIEFAGIISVISLLFSVGTKIYNRKTIKNVIDRKTIVSFGKTFGTVCLFFLFWRYIGAYSVILAIIIISFYKMYRQRKLVGDTINYGINVMGDIVDSKRDSKKNRKN